MFISGCAIGVDQWAAEEVLRLRAQYSDIRLICAAPFVTFATKWTLAQKARLRHIWDAADVKGFVLKDYSPNAYLTRNRFMIDRAQYLIAVFDRAAQPASGTLHTVRYAEECGREIIYISPNNGTISR